MLPSSSLTPSRRGLVYRIEHKLLNEQWVLLSGYLFVRKGEPHAAERRWVECGEPESRLALRSEPRLRPDVAAHHRNLARLQTGFFALFPRDQLGSRQDCRIVLESERKLLSTPAFSLKH